MCESTSPTNTTMGNKDSLLEKKATVEKESKIKFSILVHFLQVLQPVGQNLKIQGKILEYLKQVKD